MITYSSRYSTGMPAIFNTTLLNNNHKPALVENAKWISDASPNDALIVKALLSSLINGIM